MTLPSLPIILVIALLPACCAPAQAPAAPAPQFEERCPAPMAKGGSWAFNRGWGSGDDRAGAVRHAVDDARARLERRVDKIAFLSAAERGDLKSRITGWKEPRSYPDANRFQACAVAYLRMDAVEGMMERARQEFSRNLEESVEAIKATLGAAPPGAWTLRVGPPAWADDGRAAEPIGPALALEIQGALSEGGGFSISSDDMFEVELLPVLSEGAERCRLALRVRRTGEYKFHVEVFDFSPRAFGFTTCAALPETFIADRRMGLVDGRRVGSGDLRVDLSSPALLTGELCEGCPFEFTVTASEAAWVRIYSIADDGRILLGWASPEPVLRWTPDDHAVPVRLSKDLRYRLFAVAVPAAAGADFGDGLPPAGCFGNRGTGVVPARIAPEAAMAALSFVVVRGGEGNCPANAEAATRAGKLRAALENLQTCPGSP